LDDASNVNAEGYRESARERVDYISLPSGDDDDGTSIWMSQSNIVAGYSTLEVSDPNSGAVTKLNHKPFVVRSVATSAELRWYWPV
jgi:hypothetical protein